MRTVSLKIIPFLLITISCATQRHCSLSKNTTRVIEEIMTNKYCDEVFRFNKPKIQYVLIDCIIMNSDESSEKERQLLCICNNKLVHAIDVPISIDCSGFSINWIKKNKQGFEISIEYGTINYWNKIFYFAYINTSFYLYKIKSTTFNKNSPELYFEQSDIVNLLPIDKFSLTNYCND